MHRRRKQRHLPAPLLALIDILLIGLCLCVFALFHHVLPTAYTVDLSLGAQAGDTSPDAQNSDLSLGAQAAPETGLTPLSGAPEDAFTDGEVILTDSSYQSENIRVTTTRYEENGVVYYVQDICIRYLENLKTAFAGNAYGRGLRAYPLDMAVENNAIAAINGDYYGNTADSGVVIRNGYLYRDNPSGDVLVLYSDGVMRVFSESEFDGETAMAQGAYQAWCFGPSLLDENGRASVTDTSGHVARSNPRTAIGYYAPGHYCFIAVDGRSDESGGMTLDELAALCEQLGCALAYNLDGGKTSAMTFGSALVNEPAGGGRASSDIIYIAELEANAQ